MKKIFIIIILSCYSDNTQKIITRFDSGEPKIVEYYRILLNDSTLIKMQEFYKNGIIKYQTEFNDNLSKCSSYDIDGRIKDEKYFTNNKVDSVFIFDKDGIRYLKE